MRKSWLYLILLIILAVTARLAFLNSIPAGINFEEIDYLLNAKTVYTAWTDISGQWNPLSLTTPPADEPRGELLPLILAPIIGPLPFSLFNARLPFALIGTFAVVLAYLLARKLFSEPVARVSGLVAAFNPWLIFSSRLGYDVPTSATFYLLAWVLLLYLRGRWILLASLPLFLAFHTYIGAKLIVIPFTAAVCWFAWKKTARGKFGKHYFLVFLFSLLLSLFFLFRLHSLPANARAGTLFTPSHDDVASLVNDQRRLSLATSGPVNLIGTVYVNKLSIYSKEIINRILGAFSTQLLFFAGDVYPAYFLWDHGIFYYSDALFLLLGLYVLVRKYRQGALLLVLLLPSFLLPAVLSGTKLSYVYRSYLLYVSLTMIIGLGIWGFLGLFKSRLKAAAALLIVLYSLEFLNFAQDYFLRNPVYHESQFQLTSRLVSRYLVEEAKSGRKIVVVGADPNGMLRQFTLYSGLFNRLGDSRIRLALAERFKDKSYFWDNITFTNNCDVPKLDGGETVIWHYDKPCQKIAEFTLIKPINLARISDSGADYKIYYGQACSQYGLANYIRSVSSADLNIESLPIKKYCQTFFEASP